MKIKKISYENHLDMHPVDDICSIIYNCFTEAFSILGRTFLHG